MQQQQKQTDVDAAMTQAAKQALDIRLDWHEAKAAFRNALVREAIAQNNGGVNKAAMQLRLSEARVSQLKAKLPESQKPVEAE